MADITNGIITITGRRILSNLISDSSADAWPLYIAIGEGTTGEQVAYGSVSTGDYVAIGVQASETLLAQSFQLDTASTLSSVKLALDKEVREKVLPTDPAGNLWVEIHSSTAGTSTTKNASTNIVGQASANVNCSSVGTGWGWIEFTFSGTKPQLDADTTYYLVLYGSFTIVDSERYIRWAYKSSGTYTDGTAYSINAAMTWTAAAGDFSFKIYGYGLITPSEYDTALVSEVMREAATVVDTTARVYLRAVFTADATYTIGEVGVFDADSGGNMVFSGAQTSGDIFTMIAADTYTLDINLVVEQG